MANTFDYETVLITGRDAYSRLFRAVSDRYGVVYNDDGTNTRLVELDLANLARAIKLIPTDIDAKNFEIISGFPSSLRESLPLVDGVKAGIQGLEDAIELESGRREYYAEVAENTNLQ